MTEIEKTANLDPVVQSTANPSADLLLELRAIIQSKPDIQGLFLQYRRDAKSIAWLRDMIAARMAPHILGPWGFRDILEGCLYLADEYNQLGEGYFIVSTETGRTVSVVTDADLYDPGLQVRHTGDMAQALKRLKPSTESMMVTYFHEKDREKSLLQTLSERLNQTTFLKQEGDPRLRMATRQGRREIAKELSTDDPWELIQRSGGTVGMFLRHFPLKPAEEFPEGSKILEGTASFRSTLKVQDPLTMNLQYNRLGTLRAAAPQGWVRDIARQLSEQAYKEFPASLTVDAENLIASDLEGIDLWVADPDTYKHILGMDPTVKAVPVEGVSLVGLKSLLGYLSVSHTFHIESRELFQRWEVVASLEYKLCVFDWKSVTVLPVVGVPRQALVEH